MKFGPVPVAESCGAILAHSLRTNGVKWKKGRVLSEQDARELAAAGVSEIVAARMEADDAGEDAAAARIGKKIAGRNVRAAAPMTGRVNFFAEADGILQFRPETIAAMNRASSEIALAVPPPHARARAGALIGTLKIIPFAVADSVLQKCEAAAGEAGGVLSVAPFVPRRAALIQTVLPGMSESVLEKTRRVTRARLAELRCELVGEKRCAHRADAIVAAMREIQAERPKLFLIAGASAICDARDEIPAAAMLFGADSVRVGMPADPGNLLAFARAGDADIVGMPGCARSPKWNGLDLVLARVCAESPPSDDDIAAMGVGGLFSEIAERPAPRAPRSAPPKICATLLAAGASRRMGENKLLAEWRGAPLIHGAAQALALARERGTIAEVIAVIGRDADKMREVLREFNFRIVENPDYAEGMSSSLRAGVSRIPADADAALIALGDMPLVTAEDIAAVAGAFSPDGGDIVIPVFNGKRGNPVLLGRAHFPALAELRGDRGARELFLEHPERVREAAAGAGILTDMDTPEALARAAAEAEKEEKKSREGKRKGKKKGAAK